MLGYLAIVTAVALARAPGHPPARWVILANLLIALLIWLVRPDGTDVDGPGRLGRLGRLIGEVYPLLLLLSLYGSLDLLNPLGGVPVHDALVQRWELALFGRQVARQWWQAQPSQIASTVFHAAYFSYYVIVPLPAVVFAWKRDLPNLRRTVLLVTAAFLFCYLAFLFFPVAGPYYEFPRPAAWFTANLPARMVYGVLAQGSSYGAAFPSSHVAATVAATAAAWFGSRRLGLALVLPTLLLSVGVVYCQMHYAVDALAGLGVGIGVGIGVGRVGRVGGVGSEIRARVP